MIQAFVPVLLSLSMLASPPDTLEWGSWGTSELFLMRFERSVNDTTLLHGGYEVYFAGNLLMRGGFDRRLKHGVWEHYHPVSRRLMSVGLYRKGYREGTWEYFNTDGSLRGTKTFDRGIPTETQVAYARDGQKRIELTYDNQNLVSSVVLYYPNGDTLLRRSCDNSEPCVSRCVHRSYYFKGPRFESYEYLLDRCNPEVEAGLRRGEDYLTTIFLLDPGRDTYLARNIVRYSGAYRKYHNNGRLWEQHYYDNGRLINVLASYSRGGRLRDGGTIHEGSGTLIRYSAKGDTARVEYYKNGLRNGPARYYEPRNRKQAEGEYTDNQPSGRWQLRGPDQRVRTRIEFITPDSAISTGVRRTQIKGHEGAYVDFMREGKWVFYDFYGDTASLEYYHHGLLNGPFRLFNSGALERAGEFRDGVPNGDWYTYNRSGKVTWKESFDASEGSGDLAPTYRLELDYPIYDRFNDAERSFEPEWFEARVLPDYTAIPWEGNIDDRRTFMTAVAGRSDGAVIFAVDVEDTGHIFGIRCLKSSRREYYTAAADFLGMMPFMYPATYAGLPRTSRQIISFYFTEIN